MADPRGNCKKSVEWCFYFPHPLLSVVTSSWNLISLIFLKLTDLIFLLGIQREWVDSFSRGPGARSTPDSEGDPVPFSGEWLSSVSLMHRTDHVRACLPGLHLKSSVFFKMIPKSLQSSIQKHCIITSFLFCFCGSFVLKSITNQELVSENRSLIIRNPWSPSDAFMFWVSVGFSS